jgi:hypothetical protein
MKIWRPKTFSSNNDNNKVLSQKTLKMKIWRPKTFSSNNDHMNNAREKNTKLKGKNGEGKVEMR